MKAEWEGAILVASNRLTSYGLFTKKHLMLLMHLLFCISALRKHDVVFLVTVRPAQRGPVKYDRTKPFREQVISLQRGSSELDCN